MSRRTEERQKFEFKTGMEHVVGHLQSHMDREEIRLEFIRTGQGDPDACKSGLKSQAIASALVSWFRDRDLHAFKQACYVAAKIDRIRWQKSAYILPNIGHNLCNAWYWLASDYEPLIAWRRDTEPFMGWTGEEKRPPEFIPIDFEMLFISYQLILALRGDWRQLSERAERWLATPSRKFEKFEPDMHFFIALAKGDISSMEAVLREIVTPMQRRWRDRYQGGYSAQLISDEAVTYAKLAWRHGYQVDVDTPYIPKEWLPFAPLAEYADPYDFMRDFDIGQPLPEED